MEDPDPESDGNSAGGSEAETVLDETVERSFTCTFCGFGMIHEVPLLQAEAQSVCYNCGDWTTQSADAEVVVEAAETAAETLADGLLTERQALAYLLREVAGLDRQTTADAMESTPSNVDNLQRRASEKVEAARDLVDGLEALEPTTAPETSDADG